MIDFTQEINDLYKEYGPSPWHSDEFMLKMAALWGFEKIEAPLNEHGVFKEYFEEINIETAPHYYCDIKIAKAPNGLFLFDIVVQVNYAGCGALPSISNRQGYKTYEEARQCAFNQALITVKTKAERGSSADPLKVKQLLSEIEDRALPQLDLFGEAR